MCESLVEPQTRKREVAALNEAICELGLKARTIVTKAESEGIEVENGTIAVAPAWRFLLDLPDT